MANMYRLIIVGHNLESKCEIANALVKHKGSFKTLSCRTKPLVKALKNLTLLGNQASCHVTPNLNTPGWEYSVPAIKGFNSKIFLYVIFRGNVDVDDDSSFKYVQKTFTNPKIIPVVYCQTKLIAAGLGSAYINYLKIHGDMGFQSKCEIGERVLQKVNEAIKTETPQWKMTSDFYIPSKTYRQPRPTPHTSPPVEQIEIDTDKIQVKEEGKPLPDLREEDWLMFYKAMVRGQARSNHIRVNVVGNQGVGKTTLVRRLQGKKTVCPDRRQAPTEALDIDENICHCVQAANGTEKQWETNLFGIDDLNVQRLAEAMSNLTAKSEGSDRSSPYEEDIFDEELLLGSDEIVEIEDVTSTATQNQYYEAAYKAKFKREQHKLILQQAKRRRECGLSSQVYVSFWDFAGQSTYYSTHQAFLSPRAVYLVLFDLSKPLELNLFDSLSFRTGGSKKCTVKESLQFWTSSISAFTSDESNGRAPIVLVGTHGDKISDEDAQKKFKEVRAAINMERVECLKIDNTLNAEYSPSDLEDLRNTLLELGLGISDEWVPAKWLDLEDALHQQKVGGKHVLNFEELQKINRDIDFPLENDECLKSFLDHLHCRGQLMYFPENLPHDLVILNPVVLAKFLNALMRFDHAEKQKTTNVDATNMNGIVSEEFISQTAGILFEKEKIVANVEALKKMLINLKIMLSFTQEELGGTKYILPSLLSDKAPITSSKPPKEKAPKIKIGFQKSFLPPGFYHLLLVSLVTEVDDVSVSTVEDHPQLYCLGASLYLKYETVLIEIYWENSNIFIELNNYSIMRSLRDMKVETFVENVELAVQKTLAIYRQSSVGYIVSIECPDHRDVFVSLAKLRAKDEVMCPGMHALSLEYIVKKIQFDIALRDDPELSNEPSPKQLARLAKFLRKEDSTSLGRLVDLNTASIEQVRNDHIDTSMQLLQILLKWKGRMVRRTPTLQLLVKILTRTGDYEVGDIKGALLDEVQTYEFDLQPTVLSKPPSQRTMMTVSSHVGSVYPLILLELGLELPSIQQSKYNNPNNMRGVIFELLDKWQQRYTDTATLQRLLSVMKHYETPTDNVVKCLASMTSEQAMSER
ncbi:uncharacterized protein LOC128245722 [Mya arenaria]|uniref:uncharacterized protein LOC128245722 n=1 Tax=Mya arenaria TaxID=6604 RepID=UPI0022E53462|nr:uncharacterized protein LOC128245722 [Mya arenaria]